MIVLVMSAELSASEVKQCGERRAMDGTVFTLLISRSFRGQVTYKLCEREKPENSFLLFKDERVIKTKDLSNSEYEEIYALYERALDYDVKDDTFGLDGSSWCLGTKRGFTYSQACFWSPSYATKERKLEGLHALGKRLMSIMEFSPDNDE